MSYASLIIRSAGRCAFNNLDWDDSQTDLANLANAGSAGSAAAGDKLWEDNWDDDDIEEEFSTQLRFFILLPLSLMCHLNPCLCLRAELEKTKPSSDAMQH